MPIQSAHSVADNVRAELARRRVRQTDLAVMLGISRTAANRRLTGQIPFDVDQLRTVAEHLGVSASELLGETASSEVAS